MNLFRNIPNVLPEELTTVLAEGENVRIEHIVSDGHASPEGFWYDQDQQEWVLLLSGSAILEFEDHTLSMNPGDHVLIPSHQRHRVQSTAATEKTLWLAVFYD